MFTVRHVNIGIERRRSRAETRRMTENEIGTVIEWRVENSKYGSKPNLLLTSEFQASLNFP